MKVQSKVSLFLCLICVFFTAVNAQESVNYYNKSDNPSANFFEIVARYNKEYEPLLKTEMKVPGWKQFKRWEHYWEKRVNEKGEFPKTDALVLEHQRMRSLALKDKIENPLSVSATPNWKSIGPKVVPSSGGGAGRLNCVTLSTKNKDLIWVGAAGGGAWKTTDGGKNWKPMTDNFASLAVNDIAIDPNNDNIVYVGTGDDWGSGIAEGNTRELYRVSFSIGIMKSTDGGATWQNTGLVWQTNQMESVAKLLVDPSNSNVVIAATSDGIYKSSDAGVSWQKKSPTRCRDLDVHPINRKIWYAGTSNAVLRSIDGGETWTNVTVTGLTNCRRTAITASILEPSTLYLIGSRNDGSFAGLFRSTDAGLTWSSRSTSPNILHSSVAGSGQGGQGWYDLAIASNHTNQNHVTIGGINIWQSTNTGTSWTIKAHWTGENNTPYVHADIHDIDYSTLTNEVFAATDGGLFKSTNNGNSWSDISGNMEVLQPYRLSIVESDPGFLICGAQDNGSNRLSNGNWSQIFGGDGMDNAINPTNKNKVYVSWQGGNFQRSTDGGNTMESMINQSFLFFNKSAQEYGDWIAPIRLDPKNPDKLYTGFLNVWVSNDAGQDWNRLSALTSTNSPIHALEVAESNPSWIYVCNKQVFNVSSNGGNTWTARTIPVPANNLTSIAIHPTNHLRACITFARYGGSTVYETTNGGQSWNDISNGMPKSPAVIAKYQKGTSTDRLFVGTDIGVYYKEKSSPKFVDFNEGLPNVSIQDIEINYKSFKLIVATFGRGIWEAQLPDCTAGTLTITKKGDTTFCQGDSLVLEAPTGYSGYTWSNGAKTRTIIVKSTGSYSVSATDAKGCPFNSSAINVQVFDKRSITIQNSSNAVICGTDSTRLTASLGFADYLWSNGASGRTVFVKTSGKFSVIGTTQDGCKSVSNDVTVETTPKPILQLIDGEFIAPDAAKFQWRADGTAISGATNKTFTPNASFIGKKISVEITTTNNCKVESNEVVFQISSVDMSADESNSVSIYPNPVQDIAYIHKSSASSANFKIIDVYGIEVYQGFIPENMQIYSVTTESFSPGMYFAKIQLQNNEIIIPFILTK